MLDENKKKVIDARKKHFEEVALFRRQKEQELHDLCVELGGHAFYGWGKHWEEYMDRSKSRWVLRDRCSACGYTITKEIEEE